MYRQLLIQARELAMRDPGKPRQVNLRKSVHSSYYALFHALIEAACNQMVGAAHADAPLRNVLARAFAHGVMKQACAAFGSGTLKASVAKGLPATFTIPAEISLIGQVFVFAQDRRHGADYDRGEKYLRAEVLALVDRAEDAIDGFLALPTSAEMKFFLACLLAWNTLAGR